MSSWTTTVDKKTYYMWAADDSPFIKKSGTFTMKVNSVMSTYCPTFGFTYSNSQQGSNFQSQGNLPSTWNRSGVSVHSVVGTD